MTDWASLTRKDFDVTARGRLRPAGQGVLDLPLPVTPDRPAGKPAGALDGQASIFSMIADEGE